ncbi:MAG TPA: hypothetical protein VGK50_08725 [Coriobacteriia bacterium]|jgi:predicted HicB family RNase H-like nuclease
MSDDDGQAEALARLVRDDPWRADYEKGLSKWPESSKQRTGAASRRGPVRLTLRLPRHVWEQAQRSAARDGMSLNTFIVGSVAKEIGEELGYGRFRDDRR